MPGKFEIMRAVRDGLNNLDVTVSEGSPAWTKAVATKLCEIGRDFGYQVGASKVDGPNRDWPEWLYDVTWLEYDRDGLLIDAPLVAECEWGNFGNIKDDFEKLLLARAGVRLMIFDEPGSNGIAERLAGMVRKFKGSRAEDAWLLAAWKRSDNDWSFRYFTIGMNAAIPFPPPSGPGRPQPL